MSLICFVSFQRFFFQTRFSCHCDDEGVCSIDTEKFSLGLLLAQDFIYFFERFFRLGLVTTVAKVAS